jgi:hypothetical protein
MSAKNKTKKIDDDLEITDMDDEETGKDLQSKRRAKAESVQKAREAEVKAFMVKRAEAEAELQKPMEYKNLIGLKVSPQNILQNLGDYEAKGFIFVTSVAYGLTLLLIMRKPVK